MTAVIDDARHEQLIKEAHATLESWEKRFGVELKSLFDASRYSRADSYREFRTRIIDGVGRYKGFAAEEADGELGPNWVTAVEYEPNYFMSRHNANLIADMTGDAVYNYVTTARKNLDQMAASESVAQFVATTLGGTIIAVGVPVAIKVAQGLIAKQALKLALTTAVKTVGLKAAIVAVVLAVAGIIYWIIWGKEAKILGVIINDTDTDYEVLNWSKSVDGYNGGNLYMAHGTTENFPVSNVNGDIDSHEVQLKSRFPDVNDQETMVAAGIFFADRKAGFMGAEGVYVFTRYLGSDPGFAYQFAIPFTKSNRANIAAYTGGEFSKESDIDAYFRGLYNAAQVDVDFTQGNVRYRSHLQSASGGVICGTASVSTPIVYRK